MNQKDISLSSVISAVKDIKAGRTSGRLNGRPAGFTKIVSKLKKKIHGTSREGKNPGSTKKGTGKHRSDRRMSMGEGKSARTPASAHLQRVITKVAYSKNNGGRFSQSGQSKAWAAHGKYLERDAGIANRLSQGYGQPDGLGEVKKHTPLWRMADEWQQNDDRIMYKIIISPEHGDRLGDDGLTAHTIALVNAMEKDFGRDLKWGAINHHNTAHPHTHLLVSSKDANGKEFEISPNYIVHGIMQRSMELLTEQLGYRLQSDIAESLHLQSQMHKVTSLDRALFEIQDENGLVKVDKVDSSNPLTHVRNAAMVKRLNHLESMGLSMQLDNNQWAIHDSTKDILEEMSVYNERNKILMRHRKHMFNPSLPTAQTKLTKAGESLTGRCLGFGVDPYSEKPYVLLEATDNKFHFLEVSESMIDEGLLAEKQWIEISLRKDRKHRLKKYRSFEALAVNQLLNGEVDYDMAKDQVADIPTISARLELKKLELEDFYHKLGLPVQDYARAEMEDMAYSAPQAGRMQEKTGIVNDRIASVEDDFEWVQLKKDYQTQWLKVETENGFELGQEVALISKQGKWIEKKPMNHYQ